MPRDILGERCKLGILIPATNTVVQPEMDSMRPEGVTNHVARIPNPNLPITDDASFVRLIDLLANALDGAAETCISAAPDRLLLGVTALSVWGGRQATASRIAALEARSGVSVTTGAGSLATGLETLRLKRIGILSPYPPVLDNAVQNFFEEGGSEVLAFTSLRCSSPLAIAAVTAERIFSEICAADTEKIEAWVQVGTNLPVARLVAQLESELGKPVLAVNPVSYWHALRSAGVDNQLAGFGTLLKEY